MLRGRMAQMLFLHLRGVWPWIRPGPEQPLHRRAEVYYGLNRVQSAIGKTHKQRGPLPKEQFDLPD